MKTNITQFIAKAKDVVFKGKKIKVLKCINWLAQDHDGIVYGFRQRPELYAGLWVSKAPYHYITRMEADNYADSLTYAGESNGD